MSHKRLNVIIQTMFAKKLPETSHDEDDAELKPKALKIDVILTKL